MSEGSFWPKTWKQAVPLIVWGILIFAAGFEGIVTLVHAEWLSSLASFVLMIGLTAVLLHWKTWLATINPNWLVGAVIVALIIITFSPLIEQQRWPFSLELTIIISAALLLFIGAVIVPAVFRRSQPFSHQELDYREQQRRFILSNLYEMLTEYLFVMSIISDKCGQTGNALAGQTNWFADYSLHRGIRRQYGALESVAKRDFTGTLTGEVNGDILQFLKEYEIVAAFPGKIEMAAGLGKTPRDQWDAAHQRCKSALRDLKASSFSGILAGSTAMETLQTMPRNR
jgi:hypothetical protein